MRRELKRYSSIGNRKGILLLCSKMFTGTREKISSIETSCSFIIGVNIKVKCAEMLFEDLGLIDILGDICISKGLKYDKKKESAFIHDLCEICFKYLINEELIIEESIKYDEDLESFYIPTSAFRLESAILRNLLKDLAALKLDGPKFYIAQEYEHLFADFIKKKKAVSQEELLKKLENERIMGDEGEAFVLEYEKKRLNADAQQAHKIKHVSLIDSGAGYDIISYHDNSYEKRRYIEVKTYNGKEHFNWSINEIESARLRRKDYYIYLVKHSEINNDKYDPLMISDPYLEVLKNSTWNAKPNSYYFERAKIVDSKEDVTDDMSIHRNAIIREGFSINDNNSIYNIEEEIPEEEKYVNFLPLYTIKAACGYMDDLQTLNNGGYPIPEGWVKVSELGFPVNNKYFIVEAKGNSMQPKINNGDLCVFSWYALNNGGGGTRDGEIVLTQCRKFYDPDYGGRYTIKKYHSEWVIYDDGTREQMKIELIPYNDAYDKIELSVEDQPITIGIFKCVLKKIK